MIIRNEQFFIYKMVASDWWKPERIFEVRRIDIHALKL